MHEAQVPTGMFIVTGGNAAKLFQFEEEALHEIPFLVLPPVAEPRLQFIRLGRNAIIGLMRGNVFTKSECPICLVSKHHRTFDGHCAQQFLCNGDIMHVSSRKLDVNWISQCVGDCVNLCAASAATYSDTFVLALVLGIAFPFLRLLRLPCEP